MALTISAWWKPGSSNDEAAAKAIVPLARTTDSVGGLVGTASVAGREVVVLLPPHASASGISRTASAKRSRRTGARYRFAKHCAAKASLWLNSVALEESAAG